jgi:hypothetical protein
VSQVCHRKRNKKKQLANSQPRPDAVDKFIIDFPPEDDKLYTWFEEINNILVNVYSPILYVKHHYCLPELW